MIFAKTSPKHSETGREGARYYIHPMTGERFISVTTAIGDAIAKPWAERHAAKLAAMAAFDRLPWLMGCSESEDCIDGTCETCRSCAIAWMAGRHVDMLKRAAEAGSMLHQAVEQFLLSGEIIPMNDETRRSFRTWLTWNESWKPEYFASEMTVISRKHGFAGTLDAGLELPDETLLPKEFRHIAQMPLICDWKTSKNVTIAHAWQLAAYAEAETILHPDGSEEPKPEIRGAIIVNVRPDRLHVRQVHLTPSTLAAFLACLKISQESRQSLGSSLSRPWTLK